MYVYRINLVFKLVFFTGMQCLSAGTQSVDAAGASFGLENSAWVDERNQA